MSYAAAIGWLAQQDPDRPMVSDAVGGLTRKEFHARSNALARRLVGHGAGPGRIVSAILPNDRSLLLTTAAVWKSGATPQLLSPKISAHELDEIVAVAEPALVVGETPTGGAPRMSTAEFLAAGESEEDLPDVVADHVRAPVSGGSTGRPKVILIRGRTLVDPERPVMGGMTANGSQVVASPLYYGGPYTFTTLALLCGNHVAMQPRFDAERTLEWIERYRADWIFLVPTMMQRIWKLGPETRQRYDLSSLREVFHSAAPCSVWLKQAWIDWLGPERIVEMYGATEAKGFTTITGGEWLEHRGSVGRMISGFEAMVADESGAALSPGEIGHIYMRDAQRILPGYEFKERGVSAMALPGGWESVGDLGSMDRDGYLYIAERRTDMILSGGANVYPAEIEAALDEFPAVRSSVVIGLPDDDLGNRVHAIVDAPGGVDEQALRDHLAGQLSTYTLPRTYEIVDAPLRDDAGKVRRAALRAERVPAPQDAA